MVTSKSFSNAVVNDLCILASVNRSAIPDLLFGKSSS